MAQGEARRADPRRHRAQHLRADVVAPYAVRALPGAPVATPLEWAELEDPQLPRAAWTMRTLPRAAGRQGRSVGGDRAATRPAVGIALTTMREGRPWASWTRRRRWPSRRRPSSTRSRRSSTRARASQPRAGRPGRRVRQARPPDPARRAAAARAPHGAAAPAAPRPAPPARARGAAAPRPAGRAAAAAASAPPAPPAPPPPARPGAARAAGAPEPQDRNRSSYAPPKLSSGDPLTGLDRCRALPATLRGDGSHPQAS